ncbi:MAG: hypothetical protein QW484_02115 [Candidatus Pacearchaeota archaeon]
MIVETNYGNIVIDLLEKEAPINTAEIVREVYENGGFISGSVWKSGDGSINVLMDCKVSANGSYDCGENKLGVMYPHDKNILFMPEFIASDGPVLILGVERKYGMYNSKIGEIKSGEDAVYKLKDKESVKIKVIKKGSSKNIINIIDETLDNTKKTIRNIFKKKPKFDLPSVVDKNVKTTIEAGLNAYGRGFLVMPQGSIEADDGKVYAINIKSEFSKLKGNEIITPMYIRQDQLMNLDVIITL